VTANALASELQCNETRGKALLERWIEVIELHFEIACRNADARMIIQIQKSGLKLS
jgi:hypothetical protein